MRSTEYPSRRRRVLLLATTGLLAAGAATACGGSHSASGSPSDVGPVSGGSTTTSGGGQHHGAAAASAAPSAAPSAGATATPPTGHTGSAVAQHALTPECTADSLTLSLGTGDAGMSQRHQPLRFTNTGGKSCVIVGFPGLSYVTGDSGRQVGAAATRDGRIGAQITLRPGEVASTTVHSVDAQVFDAAACKPTPVRGYRVYAPDDTAAIFVPLPAGTEGCAGTTPDPQLSVSTIVAGSTGQDG